MAQAHSDDYGHDDHVPGFHGIQHVGDGNVRDPVGTARALGVHGKPVTALIDVVELSVPRVVDQQIVFGSEAAAQVVQCREHLVARRVDELGHLEPVLATE